jgi:hypothetical protein
MAGTGRAVGEEGTPVNVPSAATLRTFRPLAVSRRDSTIAEKVS